MDAMIVLPLAGGVLVALVVLLAARSPKRGASVADQSSDAEQAVQSGDH